MYNEHPAFEKPEDENISVWRYMDFTKFVSLLDKKAIYFSRADKLSDKFEGSLSITTISERKNIYTARGWTDWEGLSMERTRMFQNSRREIFLNCWYMNQYESAAMWKLYVKNNEGIAIRSTFARLRDSFFPTSQEIFLGKVKYVDYQNCLIDEDNIFYAYMHKRQSFEYEHELRAGLIKRFEGAAPPAGLYIPCNLDALVEAVYVSPESSSWFKDLVVSILDKYALQKEIHCSSLDDDPVY